MHKIVIATSIFLTYSLAFSAGPEGLWATGDSSYYSPYVLTVDKSERKLAVWQIDTKPIKKIKEYKSGQGEIDGDKMVVGDKKTPEGIYFFQEQMSGYDVNYNKYGKRIFTMDYPNLFDQREGKTGYGIWLHGRPDEVPIDKGSEGCVVLRNDSIMEVSENIDLGKTPILVYDELKTVDEKKRAFYEKQLQRFLSSWHRSWEAKDINSYINHYDSSFYSQKMDKEAWKKYKASLNKTYEKIQVALSSPRIYEHDGKIVIRVLQHYTSDLHEDYGEKTLYVVRRGNGLKIIAEDWKKLNKDIVLAELGDHNFTSRTISSNEN